MRPSREVGGYWPNHAITVASDGLRASHSSARSRNAPWPGQSGLALRNAEALSKLPPRQRVNSIQYSTLSSSRSGAAATSALAPA